ncbi:alpha-1,3-rhamnosyl/mannosyltransferase [Methylohalomonas lacus]|uniref:Alpha-1,3-rhamnosyl/mannosyltransferase n=1 Tax=Methylohalomonas lacus TaxID=398773 RepID=A0AAE3HKP5_9GAMM|nr:glycosyltransferase family 1 protein [Methylohalomonas lacus]MCS3903560.1 alpha-1,3-rhamnosyl/mannosyltransferase [Methylohalomonas lacus]
MRIILNVDSLRPPLTGIGQYTLHLMRAFQENPEVEDPVCVPASLSRSASVDYGTEGQQNDPPQGRGYSWQTLRGIARSMPGSYDLVSWLRQQRFRMAIRKYRDAVYHEPNYILHSYAGPTNVVTVHDLSHEQYPQYHPKERVSWLNRNLDDSVRRADRVITVSEFVRHELQQRFPDAAEKIVTVHNGVSERFHPRTAAETAPVLHQYSLAHGGYVFAAATLEPRKNLTGLLDAYLGLPLSLREAYPLVVAGAPGWHSKQLEEKLARAQSSGEVRVLGYVPAQDLASLYAGAALFAFVSFYEGFGLPVAEAMACGVPVLTSNRASLPEISGDAAALVDPANIEAITASMQMLLEDEALRIEYASKGRQRAALFTWERCAAQTISVYRSVSS